MLVSFLSIGLNVGLNWFLAFHLHWGIAGLGFATGCVATVNFGLLYCLMRRATSGLETRELLLSAAKLLGPSALLGAVCWGAQRTLLAGWESLSLPLRVLYLLTTIGVAAGVFFGAAAALRVGEMSEVTALIKRKLSRGKAA
jgi:putative peptidoglycan lipid II flippase